MNEVEGKDMCNIAAYAGNRQAAPILLEMLRRQQDYDGGMSAGIATVHEGKLYWRKVVGSVETLMQETDALSLPGTIGIAHTRPEGTEQTYHYAHPHISMDGETAVVLNGTAPLDQYAAQRADVIRMLDENGYLFKTALEGSSNGWPVLKNGKYVIGSAETRVHLVDYYLKQGKSCSEAMALTAADLYSDNVFLMINAKVSDRLFALRTTRPMNILMGEGECYLATARVGFPEEISGEIMSLPLHHACEITRGGLTVTGYGAAVETVCEPTPYTYAEGYRRICELLRGKKDAPLYFDDLEIAVKRDMRDLWPEEHTYVQDARLVYDIIGQLQAEGKLRSEVRPQQCKSGVRNRVFMWLD